MPADRSVGTAEPAKIRVLIVGDVRLYREGLATNLASRRSLAVAGMAETATEALALVASTEPTVVVLDMSTHDSRQIVKTISREAPSTKIIAFAAEESDREVLACAEAGVAGYLPSEGSTDELVTMIENVTGGEILCSPRMAATLFRHLASLARDGPDQLGVASLTTREREIVGLLDGGLSNKEIAVRLVIEVATVKNHVHNILEKMHVNTRAEAVERLRRRVQTREARANPT